MSSVEIRLMLASDDRAAFESGNAALDEFLRRYAGQNQFKHRVGATYVALVNGQIGGFATVSPATLSATDLPGGRRGLPNYHVPVLRLARLAVDRRHQGARLGHGLMRHVFELAAKLAHEYGCVGVVVDAKPEAVAFYGRLGFRPILGTTSDAEHPTPMYLALTEWAW